jgi:magnesium transporter
MLRASGANVDRSVSFMVNTLYLPELREYLAEQNEVELREFCTALHPARTAEFMEGLTASESWEVLKHAEPRLREQIFIYFDHDKQIELLEGQKRSEVASLIEVLASDDRVDLIHELQPETVDELLPLVSPDVRRNIQTAEIVPRGDSGRGDVDRVRSSSRSFDRSRSVV